MGANGGHEHETEYRLTLIMNCMRRLEWKRGESGPVWAEKFGIGEHRMRELAAEAWKRVKAEVTDIDEQTPTICTHLANALETATAKGDLRALAQLADTYARILGPRVSGGIVRPIKIEIVAATKPEPEEPAA